MNYIDDNKTVQLKGRVACEMGSHELLITELVFNNILTGIHGWLVYCQKEAV